MRDYFASLGDSAHPNSPDPRARAITRFQELLLVSFREFSIITDETIQHERKRYRSEIIHSIESFAKRSAVRGLKTLGRFTKDDVGLIYDALYKAMCLVPQNVSVVTGGSKSQMDGQLISTADGSVGSFEEKMETRVGLKTFRQFLSEIATWARDEKIVRNGFQERIDREVAEHEFIDRLFYFWDTSCRGALSFQVSFIDPLVNTLIVEII